MQEYHLLRVENSNGSQTYHLNTAAVAIGRDPSNTITIDDPLVARHHALLRRLPSESSQYSYEVIIGEGEGRLCQDGVWINQLSCQSKVLATGDSIRLGETHISYLMASMTPDEYTQYFQAKPITVRSQLEQEFSSMCSLSVE